MTFHAKIMDLVRAFVEAIARVVMGEPVRIVPLRRIERLCELERREQLQAAERRGDLAYLSAELAKSQLTIGDLDRLAKLAKPIGDWPDEDLGGCFTPVVEPNESEA